MKNPKYSKSELDNHANQCNNNNSAYWSSRGYESHDDIVSNDDDYEDMYDDDKFYEENYSAEGWGSSDY